MVQTQEVRGLRRQARRAVSANCDLAPEERAWLLTTARQMEDVMPKLEALVAQLPRLHAFLEGIEAEDAEGDRASGLVSRVGEGADYLGLHARRLANGLRALADATPTTSVVDVTRGA